LVLDHAFTGTVDLGTGSSTLVLQHASEFGFARATATSEKLQFQLGALATGDKIVLVNVSPAMGQVSSATLGNFTLADGKSHLALELGGIAQIAVGSINGTAGEANNAYFDVKQDGNSTVLTLKAGNNVDAAMNGPQVRSAQGVTGNG